MTIGTAPSFSVSDFVAIFNQSISFNFSDVNIVGEVSNFRINRGKWVYFDLKDDEASVKFFGAITSLPGPIEDGLVLEVSGRPYLHPQFGFSVQFYSVRPVGEGSISRAQKILFKKLEVEGLFDVARKRSLPSYPDRVAIVSSKESAGYGDFIKVGTNRWPHSEFVLFDTLVQGTQAPESIVSAISKASEGQFDCIVIIRGGGSADDLIAFNDERVVRSVASSRWPTLVAIGHERDEVLAELVADVRASTPSNAAEILLPDLKSEISELKSNKKILAGSLDSLLKNLRHQISQSRNNLNELIGYKMVNSRFDQKMAKNLLSAYDPLMPLNKGYLLAYSSQGNLVKSAKEASKEISLKLKFIDGIINTKLENKE